MHRPPQFPSILASRQSYGWISRINQKFKELSALDLSATEQERLTRWLEAEFVSATLSREGASVSHDDVVQVTRWESLAAEPGGKASAEGDSAAGGSADGAAILTLVRALRLVQTRVKDEGRNAALTVELLLKLRQPAGAAALRQGDLGGLTVRAEHLPGVLENACRWFTMASIAELNPVEQAAIVLLRLLEIVPFAEANERTAMVAASLFTMRGGLPPVIVKPEKARDYHEALGEGMRMNTQPMVELVAGAVERSLDEMLRLAIVGN